jgi:hypothetical protein
MNEDQDHKLKYDFYSIYQTQQYDADSLRKISLHAYFHTGYQCCGSMKFGTDVDPDPAIFVSDSFFAYYFLKAHFSSFFSKTKSHIEVKNNRRNHCFA